MPVRLFGMGITGCQQAEPIYADLFDQPREHEVDDSLLETLDPVGDRCTDTICKSILTHPIPTALPTRDKASFI